jgi:predicted nucleic acid-binding protein
MTSPYLFDSHTLLAFFQNEEGAEIVAEILQRAEKKGLDRFICVINLGEIMYIIKRRFGDSKKLEVLLEFTSWAYRCFQFHRTLYLGQPKLKHNI